MEGTTLPRTPGRDFAGVVADGPAELLRTEVWGTGGDIGFTRDGSHAEYLLLPSEAVRQKPRSLSLIEAGSIGLTYITAWLAIVDAHSFGGRDVARHRCNWRCRKRGDPNRAMARIARDRHGSS